MFFKATISQIAFLLKQKGALFVFYVMLAMVLLNFTINVISFQGTEIVHMYHPMKLLLFSYNWTDYNADFTLLFIQLYPLLVVCPAGFSLERERKTGEDMLAIARLGNLRYQFSKFVAAVLTTVIVFSIPLLIEIALNCIAFPLAAQGDLSNMGLYDPGYVNRVKNYLFSDLYIYSPYLYAVLGALFFGVQSGLLGGFTVAFSSVFKVKYLVFLFLPVFLLLNATLYLSSMFSSAFSVEWYHYFLLFDETVKNPGYPCVIALILLVCSITGIIWGGKKDCLN